MGFGETITNLRFWVCFVTAMNVGNFLIAPAWRRRLGHDSFAARPTRT